MSRSLSEKTGNVLLELEQIVVHASVYWEQYWVLTSGEDFSLYNRTFNDYLYWYSAAKEASLIAAVATISKFFETNSSSINIHYFIKLLGAEPEDWSREITEMQKIVDQVSSTSKDITILRSNVFLHKSRDLSTEEAFGYTSSTRNGIRSLIEQMRRCVSIISMAVSGQEIITDTPSQKTAKELRDILNKLTGSSPVVPSI